MGSPISNVISEWKMRIMEKRIIQDHKNEIRLWIRYVDDIFIITNRTVNLKSFLNEINKYDNNIQFILEEEKNRPLPYLDVKITYEKERIQTTIYR